MGPIEISCGGRPALSRQCTGAADAAQHRGAGRARDQGRVGRGHVAARLFAAAGCHDGRTMGHGGLSRISAFCTDPDTRKRGVPPPDALSLFSRFSWKPHSRIASESALSQPACLALNLEVLRRGLAAIGDFFVFDRLSFVERGKASFLDRRNMNKNVLATTGRLDESKTLGRVEPLYSTFSHHVSLRGIKNDSELPVPANRPCPRRARYEVWGTLDSLNGIGISAQNPHYCGAFALFAAFATIYSGETTVKPNRFEFY